MPALNQLLASILGDKAKSGDEAADQRGLKLLDQEMQTAKRELAGAKEELTKVMTVNAGIVRDVQRLRGTIQEHERYAEQALDKGEISLAEEICALIAEFEEELLVQDHSLSGHQEAVNKLKRQVKSTERSIETISRQINLIKAAERIHRAHQAASERFSESNAAMSTATESLERIKKRQQRRSDIEAAKRKLLEKSDEFDLDRRMREAGIMTDQTSGANVLARIRAKREKSE